MEKVENYWPRAVIPKWCRDTHGESAWVAANYWLNSLFVNGDVTAYGHSRRLRFS